MREGGRVRLVVLLAVGYSVGERKVRVVSAGAVLAMACIAVPGAREAGRQNARRAGARHGKAGHREKRHRGDHEHLPLANAVPHREQYNQQHRRADADERAPARLCPPSVTCHY